MVHGELMKEGRVQLLSFKQVRQLERIDYKKAVQERELDVAREGVTQAGNIASSALTATAAFATGAGGYVLALLAIHYFEKIAKVKQQISGSIDPGYYIYNTVTGAIVGGPFADEQTASQLLQNSTIHQIENLTGQPYSIKHITVTLPATYEMVALLSTDEAVLAKTLLTTAAASGVAGNLLGGLFHK